jgi:tRNA threonylcarbamoyladenosine biosynthesis protein TsaB
LSSRLHLGVETSGTATGLALVRGDNVVAEVTRETGASHNEVLLGLLAGLLDDATASTTDLGSVGVVIGPGMFTSLRVGLSTAKGLCAAKGIPLKGIDTLKAMYLSLSVPRPLTLCAVDARKSQVYAALFSDGIPLIEPLVTEPAVLPRMVMGYVRPGGTMALVGTGRATCASALRAAGIQCGVIEMQNPSPAAVAAETRRLLDVSGPDDLAAVQPLYIRRTDAELNRERL